MFSFAGRISRRAFAIAALVRIGLLVGVMVSASACRWTGDCGYISLALRLWVIPIVVTLFIFSFAWISVRRATDVGLPWFAGLLIPILFSFDQTFLILAGMPLPATFASGAPAIPFPKFLAAGFVIVSVFAVLPPKETGHGMWPEPPGAAIALASLALALSLCLLGGGGASLVLPRLPALLVPTFCMVLALVWSAVLCVRRPGWVAIGCLVLSVLPLLHWAYTSWSDRTKVRVEAAEVAAIPRLVLDAPPATLVVESTGSNELGIMRAIPHIRRLISKLENAPLRAFEPPFGWNSKGKVIDSLPASYLLLKTGSRSSFVREGESYEAGSPFELRIIGPERNDLVAAWYRTVRAELVPLPILTINGWFRVVPSPANVRPPPLLTFLQEALPR